MRLWYNGAMLEQFTVDTFRAVIGSRFAVSTPAGELELLLLEAAPVKVSEAAALQRAPFSIVFHGPRETILPQGTYRFAHETIGEFEMFIVPLQPSFTAARYEAVFA